MAAAKPGRGGGEPPQPRSGGPGAPPKRSHAGPPGPPRPPPARKGVRSPLRAAPHRGAAAAAMWKVPIPQPPAKGNGAGRLRVGKALNKQAPAYGPSSHSPPAPRQICPGTKRVRSGPLSPPLSHETGGELPQRR